MRSVTFGNSYKLSFHKQPGAVQDQRRVQFSPNTRQSSQLDNAKIEKMSTEYFDSADRASAKRKVEKLLHQQGIDSFIHTGPSGTFLLTSGPNTDTLSLYRQVREQNSELRHIDRAREFDQKLIEAGVIDPDSSATVNVNYALKASGDKIRLTNKPEILQTTLGNS